MLKCSKILPTEGLVTATLLQFPLSKKPSLKRDIIYSRTGIEIERGFPGTRPNTFRDILQRSTHDHYRSILQSNLVIQIEAWLEKSVFRFQFEKFERRTDSNFEQQNQILILGQNAWPSLTVIWPKYIVLLNCNNLPRIEFHVSCILTTLYQDRNSKNLSKHH